MRKSTACVQERATFSPNHSMKTFLEIYFTPGPLLNTTDGSIKLDMAPALKNLMEGDKNHVKFMTGAQQRAQRAAGWRKTLPEEMSELRCIGQLK